MVSPSRWEERGAIIGGHDASELNTSRAYIGLSLCSVLKSAIQSSHFRLALMNTSGHTLSLKSNTCPAFMLQVAQE